MNCIKCGAELKVNDIGAYKKFINRGASEFECMPCICKTLKIEQSELEKKIEFLKKHGCTLFN
jgi:hypothetical protein